MPDIKLHRNIPFISFIARTWHVLAVVVTLNFLVLWNHAWKYVENGKDEWGNVVWRGLTTVDIFGSIIYIPPILVTTYWISLLCLALHNRKTVEKDANVTPSHPFGRYYDDWNSMDPHQRIYATVALRGIFIIAGAIVAAAVAR